MSNLLEKIIAFSLNMMIFSAVCQSQVIYADSANYNINQQFDSSSLYDLKIATGEKIIDQGSGIYKGNIYSNKSEVIFEVQMKKGSKPSDFIVTDDNNTIIGSISENGPYLIKVNLKYGSNTIVIRNRRDNLKLYTVYLNYENLQVKGLRDYISIGDSMKLEVIKDQNTVYNNVKWMADKNNIAAVDREGNITALNSGIANITGEVYDNDNNIIGNVNIDFNVCEKKISGWIKDNNSWYYIDEQTNEPRIGWFLWNGEWYFTDSNGIMQTGWLKQNGKWYYLNQNGTMAISWIKDNGKWYLMDAGGEMKTGWVKDHGNWYYLNDDGSMQTGDKVINNVSYKFNSHGELQKN